MPPWWCGSAGVGAGAPVARAVLVCAGLLLQLLLLVVLPLQESTLLWLLLLLGWLPRGL
jgi:hypothetical protein